MMPADFLRRFTAGSPMVDTLDLKEAKALPTEFAL
jgi:hypothetical protein